MTLWQRIRDRITRFIDKQDMSEYIEPPGIGVAWLWKLPDSHPFFLAAVNHDREYDLLRAGQSPYKSSKIPDTNFYKECVEACSKLATVGAIDFHLAQARVFYSLVRSWGALRWEAENGVDAKP